MLRGHYFLTVFVLMVLGGVIGTLLGALYGWAGQEAGWWGVGLLLGLFYGTIGGVAVAERSEHGRAGTRARGGA